MNSILTLTSLLTLVASNRSVFGQLVRKRWVQLRYHVGLELVVKYRKLSIIRLVAYPCFNQSVCNNNNNLFPNFPLQK